jgi:Ca2+-binding RTX toxin-like protein
MSIFAQPPGRRALAVTAVAGACLAATLALGTDQASAAYTAQVQAGTLQITGDAASDTLDLQIGGPNTLAVSVNGTLAFSVDASTFTAIDVKAGGGDDVVRGSNGIAQFGHLTIDGGAGDDTIGGGDGADTLIGGTGDDLVDGNIGADTALLGSGNDHFKWDPGDGSDTVEGQGGKDVMDFNGSNAAEHIDVSANGSRVRLTRDIAAITMDFDDIEALNVRTLGSADTVTVGDLSGTDLDSANVDLNGFDGAGDGAADTVIANGTDGADDVDVSSDGATDVVSRQSTQVRVVGSEPTLDNVNVATLGGDDDVTAGVDFTGTTPVTIDGGEGADTTTYSGTSGDDNIGLARNVNSTVAVFTPTSGLINNTAVEELLVRGLAGADTIKGQNGIGTLTHLTVDGGAGDDTLGGGDGADLLLGGTGNDLVDGNIGADTAQLGSGNDHFQWDPGDGSDTVEGQSGKDVVDFNGSNIGENIDVSANGSRVRLTRNVAAVNMDFDDVEGLNVRTLGGADTVTVNDLGATDLDSANVDLNAFDGSGDGAADTVIANGTDAADYVDVSSDAGKDVVSRASTKVSVTGSEPTLDNVNVATLGGDDDVTAGVDFTGTTPVSVIGGEGSDTITYDGSSADDTIGIARNGAAAAVFTPTSGLINDATVEELLVRGLAGADTIKGQNGIGTLTHLTIDGGAGDDTIGGGDGADLLLGGTGNDLVDGNIGADTALLGAGDDRFQWDPGDGSDTVEGQGGSNALSFNGSNIGENIDVSANGSRGRLTRNVAAVAMDFDNIQRLDLRVLGGSDAVTVGDLTGTALKSANVDLGAFDGTGDASPDTVTVNGTNRADRVRVTRSGAQVLTTGLAAQTTISGSEGGNDTLRVNTLDGRDTVTVDPDAELLITPVIDLGPGQ